MPSEGNPSHLLVADLRGDELPSAAALLARAYRDNPLTLALIGDDVGTRMLLNEQIFGVRIASQKPPALAARSNAGLVGVCGFDTPGGSMMSAEDRQALLDAMSAAGGGVLERAMSMLSEFGRKAPAEPHWHLGPVGVEPDQQGHGIGSELVTRFCQMMDAEGGLSFLETDSESNAHMYEKFGFVTIESATVIGVPIWFQVRTPKGRSS